ncbi:MAG: large conductance mechanosensitive channel protein MscL [Ginsengibacter sp.]
MSIIKEFKEFALKGNILDLAVAVVIGVAFGKIVTALVDNILMPIIGSFIGSTFATLTLKINNVHIKYGLFIQAAIDFLIVAFILFLIIKTAKRFNKPKEVVVVAPSSTDTLLMEIRDELKRGRNSVS